MQPGLSIAPAHLGDPHKQLDTSSDHQGGYMHQLPWPDSGWEALSKRCLHVSSCPMVVLGWVIDLCKQQCSNAESAWCAIY
jgi:hypothetical protein